MRNFRILFLIIGFIFLVNVHVSHGEVGVEYDSYVWTPKNMIAGEEYEGLIVIDRISNTGNVVILSTSEPTTIQIPESIIILPYTNHGIFPIKPLKEGYVKIFATMNGEIISADIHIHSSSKHPERLKIILPTNTTKTEDVIGYIVTVDSKNSPAPVSKNTTVYLSATSMIDFIESEIEIKSGQHYAKFHAKIRGSGKIFANAEDFTVGENEITKITDDITVRIAVAPNIIMENSKAFFFVWLEKEGKPYKPSHVVHAFVSSNNLKSVRFNEASLVRQYSDSMLKVSLVDGIGRGHVISQESGIATVTVNVDSVGSAQTNVVVGQVLLDQNFHIIKPDKSNKITQIESKKPNIAFVWFYPDITDSKSYGIIALYKINSTQQMNTEITLNKTSMSVLNSINQVVPVPIDGRTVTLNSASGLIYPNILTLTESNEIMLTRGIGSTHAFQFEVFGSNQGNYTVSISGPGLEQFQSELAITPSFQEYYRLKMTQIPTMFGIKNDLAIISIVDVTGALIDVQKAFNKPVRISVSSKDKHVEFNLSTLNSVIYTGILNEKSKLIISSDNLEPIEEEISPSGISSSITLDVPHKIHISEPFPFVIHESDSYGIPIRKLNSTNTSSTFGLTDQGKYLQIDSTGTKNFAVAMKNGADSKEIEAFANRFDISIIIDKIMNKIDQNFELKIVSDIREFQTIIESPFPYRKIDEQTYHLFPNKEGKYNVTFIATKKGFASSKVVFPMFVEKLFNMSIKAVGSDGNELNIRQQIQLGNITKSIVTPINEEVKPQFLELIFPTDFVVNNRGYQLSEVIVGDERIFNGKISNLFLNKNTQIIAHYDRMVRIEAENAHGSGFYPYGQQVTLIVEPKDKILFFIREVFDGWEGINSTADHVIFVATEDVKIKAILKEDYTFLMLTIALFISIVFYINFVKHKGLDLRFYLDNNKFVNLMKHINFNIKLKRKMNLKDRITSNR